MKKINCVKMKNGSEEFIDRRIMPWTYWDYQTKGELARKNVKKAIEEAGVNYSDVVEVELIDTEDNGYDVTAEAY